ncbi:DUF3265 domain-containing protein [Vibrio parahaemolyticus]|nr:DUF3265 domain-containing protein [Vibrio parahaemolyticus]TOK35725.1 DUF3265 domain-containing protein [Vibrio parahaemolyticus]
MLYFSILACARGFKGSVLTSCLRGNHNAWHFQFALSSVVTALFVSFCVACLYPLTRR